MRNSPTGAGPTAEWAAPTAHEKSQIRMERLDRVVTLLLVNAYASIPASLTFAWLMRSATTLGRVAIFLVVSLVSTVVILLMSLEFRRRRSAGADVALLERWFGPALAIRGAAWGLPLLVMPLQDAPLLFALQLLFVVASAFSNVIVTGPIKEYFHAFNAGVVGTGFIGILVGNETAKVGLLGALIALYVMTARLQGPVYDTLVEALVSRRRMERVNKELQRAITQLGQQATHDALTGLSNRVHLLEQLDGLLGGDEADSSPLAVFFVDLDRFKSVNDSLGHAAGDQLLRIVAYRVRQGAGPGALLARLGGDEFIVVIHPVMGSSEACAVGERIRRALATPTHLEGRDLNITASIGVALSSPGNTSSDLLRHADSAVYKAKQLGRNRVELFDDQLRTQLLSRMDDETELRSALMAGELVPWFQPIVNMRTGEVVAAEVLARWLHRSRGVIPASKFIALAEESGLVDAIGGQVLGRALTTRAQWAERGLNPEFRISLNISARQLCRPDTPDHLMEAISRNGCDPALVALEVTESGLLSEIEQAAKQLTVLRSHGIEVSLDDFGTGYSSLALLHQLPLDGVKIDGSFVQDLTTDRRDRAVVRALVRLAAELGLYVVAEAVETAEQVSMLTDLGCELAQGHFWAPAVASTDLPDTIQRLQRPTPLAQQPVEPPATRGLRSV